MGLLARLAEAAKVLTRPDEDEEDRPALEGEVEEAQAPEEKADLSPRIGSAGNYYQGGIFTEETHEDLDTLTKRVDRMGELKRGDSVIAGQLRRRRIPVLRAEWTIEPGEEAAKLPSEKAAEAEMQAEEEEGDESPADKPRGTSNADVARRAPALSGQPKPTTRPMPKALADVETDRSGGGPTRKDGRMAPKAGPVLDARPSGQDDDDGPLSVEDAEAQQQVDLARQDASAKLVRLLTANLLGKGPLPYRMATTWRQYLTESLTAEVYGFALFERTLKLADGPWGSAVVIDGLWYMHPRSLDDWHLDDDGQLGAITQLATKSWWTWGDSTERMDQDAMLAELLRDPGARNKLRTHTEFRYRAIPVRRLVVHVMDREGSDYEGNATIRPAYMEAKHAAFLRIVQRISAVKRGIPIPEVKLTTGFDPQTKANAESVAKRMTMGGQERLYVVSTPGVDLKYVDMQASAPDFNADMRGAIHRTALLLGTESSLIGSEGASGSYSASQTQRKDFDLAVEDLAEWLRESTQAQVIEPLAMLNDAQSSPPVLRVANIITQALADLMLAKDKGALTWTGRDEQQLRKVLRQPLLTDVELAQREQQKAQAQEAFAKMAGADGDEKAGGGARRPPSDRAGGSAPAPLPAPKPPTDLSDKRLGEAMPARKLWREPTEHERMHVRLAEIDDEFDDFERDFVQAVKPLRAEAIREAAEKTMVRGLDVKAPSIERMGSRRLRSTMKRLAGKMREFGRDTARTEIRSQVGVRFAEPAPFDPFEAKRQRGLKGVTKFSDELDQRLETVVGLNVRRILEEAIGVVQSRIFAHLEEGWTEDESREGAVRDTLDRSDAVLEKMARDLASRALNGGRAEVAEQAAESGVEVTAVRNEAMDDRTCEPCAELDGTEYALDSPEYEEYMPPNKCDGGAYCRGVYNLIVKG